MPPTDTRPIAAPFIVADESVISSTSSNADSADDVYVNIAGAEAVADASTTRAPNAADVGRSASPTRRSAKLLPTWLIVV